MIERLLPDAVVSEEAWQDALEARLFPEEERLLGNSVEKRRREFATGRACARAALARLGSAPCPIVAGERGEPLWPPGVVGSITHCDGYRACAVAREEHVLALGIDAEPNLPLPEGLLHDIAGPEELPLLDRLSAAMPAVHWDRLLFSAKEAAYKAWFPLAGRWLGFHDADITIDAADGTFGVRLLIDGPLLDEPGAGDSGTAGRLTGFTGRWLVRNGLILTAIAVPRSHPGRPARAGLSINMDRFPYPSEENYPR